MLYTIGKILFSIIFSLLFKWEITGAENIPDKGPLIICSNHISWWDPPLVGCSIKRRIYFMAKEELFKNPLLGYVLKAVGAFPIKRGEADRKAIKKSLEILEQAKVLGIFPEGTRSKTGELQKPEPGVALIALKSNAQILPVAIKGPYKLFKPVKVIVGKPYRLSYSGGKLTTEVLQQNSEQIMEKIKLLLGT
jgi:1-acyl-sn-glycerol-3-phosphate acyltransferase